MFTQPTKPALRRALRSGALLADRRTRAVTPPRTFYEPGGLDVLFYGDVVERRTHDIEFYTALARRIGGPVIEMGCGTGGISISFARQGIVILGVDSSAATSPKAFQERSTALCSSCCAFSLLAALHVIRQLLV